MRSELCADGLVVAAGTRRILDGASLRVPAGRLTALVGGSGAGKSTLGRALVGLVQARPGVTAGTVRVTGDAPLRWAAGDRPSGLHGVGLAWSSQDAWGGLSPFERVGTALRGAGAADVPAALRRVGLPAAASAAHPHTLSGGMARRAGLAVALAARPRFLVADEPTAGLDPTIGEAMLRLLASIAGAGVGVLVLGHDVLALRRHADAVAVIAGGVVEETVPADVPFSSPAGRALDAAAAGPPWA